MGRGKKKQNANRRAKMKKRNEIRVKMGKPIFFTRTNCSGRMNGVSNNYSYKANMHKLIFTGSRFYNVKYQASIITNCNFRDAKLIGVDFYNCNMRGVSFKNASLKNVVFYNCNLKNVEFQRVSFSNVVFICTNTKVTHNLNINDSEITILCTYKKLDLPDGLEADLLNLTNNSSIFNAKVLHVNKRKLNYWVLNIIQEKYGMEGLRLLSNRLHRKEQWNNLYTVYSYITLLENSLKR